jgi:hypothetical protein
LRIGQIQPDMQVKVGQVQPTNGVKQSLRPISAINRNS